MKTEGLFRIASSQGVLDSIRQKLDDDEELSFLNIHPHIRANVIKIFLRELPEPLISYHCYDDFVKATSTLDLSSIFFLTLSHRH